MKKRYRSSIALLTILLATPISAQILVAQERAEQSDRVPTLWVCGDSTANNGAERGWASHLQQFFDPAKMKIENRCAAAAAVARSSAKGYGTGS